LKIVEKVDMFKIDKKRFKNRSLGRTHQIYQKIYTIIDTRWIRMLKWMDMNVVMVYDLDTGWHGRV